MRATAAVNAPLVEPAPPTDLEDLFREHYRRVFGAAYRITGNAMDAEDVLQTVFSRLADRGEDHGLRAGAGPYLRRAAVNAALDVVRARNRRPDVPLDGADGQREGASGEESAALREWLRGALGRLNPRAAEMFALRYLEGFDNGEIAAMLGTSPGTVGVVLHRARRRLRLALLHTDETGNREDEHDADW